jgi:hypothetical protein
MSIDGTVMNSGKHSGSRITTHETFDKCSAKRSGNALYRILQVSEKASPSNHGITQFEENGARQQAIIIRTVE